MTDMPENKLEQAYELINLEQLDEAQRILLPILKTEPENIEAWWLLANAVTDPTDAREVLQQVLELNPQHSEAQERLEELNAVYPPEPEPVLDAHTEDLSALETESATPPIPQPPEAPEVELEQAPQLQALDLDTQNATPAVDFSAMFDEDETEPPDLPTPPEEDDIPPFPESEGEPVTTEEAPQPRRERSVLRSVLIVLLVIVLAIAVVMAISNNRPTTPGVAPTESVAAIEPSEAMLTVLEAAESAANAQSDLLGGEASVNFEARGDNKVLVIRVCRSANLDLSSAMDIAMDLAARYSISVQDEVTTVGADLINCDRDDILLSATAPIDQATAYANASLTSDEFRATWEWMP